MTTLISKGNDLPATSEFIAWEEFLKLCGCPGEFMQEVLEMGWVTPSRTATEGALYSQGDVYRVRKLSRICEDFEIPTLGGTIIVDLLTRVDELERMVEELRAGLK